MSAMQNAFAAVGCIVLIALAGTAVYVAGLLRDEHLPLLSKLVIKVALPCMIVENILGQYTPESLAQNATALLASFVSVAITLLLSVPLGKLLRLPKERLGAFTAMFSFSNSVFIGVPVSRALFGDAVIPYTLLYYIANTLLFWSAGYMLMCRWGARGASPKWRLNAPLVVIACCVALVYLRFSPPAFFMDACGYLGDLVTPLSLLYTGATIARMIRARKLRWERGYLAVCAGRFLICPCLLVLCALLLDVPNATTHVLLVQAGMPVMTQTALVADSVGADGEYVAGGMALTTILSLAAIPLYMLLIETAL